MLAGSFGLLACSCFECTAGWLASMHASSALLYVSTSKTSLMQTASSGVQAHDIFVADAPCTNRYSLPVCRFYQDCDFSRALTSEDMLVLCQLAGFKHHPMLCDTELLSAQQWFNFGQRFVR